MCIDADPFSLIVVISALIIVAVLNNHCAHCAHALFTVQQHSAQSKLPQPKSQIVTSNSVLSFQNTEGADWRKIPLKSFLMEEDKISWKACPGRETKMHLVRSSDSNEMHRCCWLKQLQYQETYISNHYDRWYHFIALWFREQRPGRLWYKIEPPSLHSESRDAQSPLKRLF